MSKTESRRTAVPQIRGPFLTLAPHPRSLNTEAELIERARGAARPVAVDLFCGAGGLTLGLQQAGFDVLLGVDHNDSALETHASISAGLTKDVDMTDSDEVDALIHLLRRVKPTLIAGGPPCQPFSRAGRSKIRSLVETGHRPAVDDRSTLWETFVYVVEQVKPRAVLLENVPDMALGGNMVIMRAIVERLERCGYDVYTRLLDASKYGVPQHRQRFILVALLKAATFRWPNASTKIVSVGDAIGDLPPVKGGYRPPGGAEGFQWYSKPPQTPFQRRARSGPAANAEKVYDHITRPVRDDDRIAFRAMTAKTRYSELDPKLKRYRDDIFDDKYKKLDKNELCRSITAHIAKDGYWYIHPTQARTLTVREAARIQTFPDHIRFAGPPSNAFKQIGNAVPPRLAEVVGRRIIAALRMSPTSRPKTYQVADALQKWIGEQHWHSRPWLHAGSVWLAVAGALAFTKTSQFVVRQEWPHFSRYRTHSLFLASRFDSVLSLDKLRRLALWLEKHPDALASAAKLAAAPGVGPRLSETAMLAGGQEDVVVGVTPTLRVAARFFGTDVDTKNRLSDGRMALARMIGIGKTAQAAQLALFEISERFCQPTSSSCDSCPLRKWCASAGNAVSIDAAS